MEFVRFPESDVPDDLRRQVVALQQQAWSGDDDGLTAWHDPTLEPLSVILVVDDRVVSALDILRTTLDFQGSSFAVSGISAMVTDRARRGGGYGRTLAAEAMTTMVNCGADLGIFTCDTPLQPFYSSAGWQHLPGTVLLGGTPDDPFPSDQFDKVTMAKFFSPRATQAATSFVGARIPLYPGEIDRLW